MPCVRIVEHVKKGKYYIGDPCYCFSSEKWDKILDASDCLDQPYKEGRKILVAFQTAFGDGTYEDQNSFEYDVDSGLIGLIPVSMADKADHGLREITLENDTECFSQEGVLHFGNISIDTN